MTKADDIIAWMRANRGAFPYVQILGVWDSALGSYRRPTPGPAGADCTSVIQYAYLRVGAPDPGYYTAAARLRGRLVTTSHSPNYASIRKGDVVLMQWRGGTWHAELATGDGTLIGHPGMGPGPQEKDLRSYLSGAAYWEVRTHDSIHNDTQLPANAGGGNNQMFMLGLKNGRGTGETIYAIAGPGFWMEFTGLARASNLNKQLTGSHNCPSLTLEGPSGVTFWEATRTAAREAMK